MRTVLKNLERKFTSFVREQRGNVAFLSAAGLSLIVAAGGTAVDMGSQYSLQRKLQDAVDQAVLAGTLKADQSETVRNAAADLAFDNNTKGTDLEPASGQFALSTEGNNKIGTYTASMQVDTVFMGLIGVDHLTVRATAKSSITYPKAEIAFVLDNTGSMNSDNRMTNLKSSVTSVLDGLNGNTNVKVAIVPFDTQVNVQGINSAYVGEFTADQYSYTCSTGASAVCTTYSEQIEAMCNTVPSTYKSTCITNARVYYESGYYYYTPYYRVYVTSYYNYSTSNCGYYRYYDVCDYTRVARDAYYNTSGGGYAFWTASNSSQGTNSASGYSRPWGMSTYSGTVSYSAMNGGGYGSGSTTVYKDNDTISANADLLGVGTANWNGCIIDRQQSYDVSWTSPTSGIADSFYPAAKCATNNLLPIMGLTNDIASAKTHVSKMTPAGNTNVTIGVQWGMEVLSPDLPFNTGVAYTDTSTKKFMIIVTDGINTQNRWTTSADSINARTLLACQAAKAKNITIYTVRVMQGDSTMLKACASGNDHFYDVTNASQLSTTMTSIMSSIKNVRITQ